MTTRILVMAIIATLISCKDPGLVSKGQTESEWENTQLTLSSIYHTNLSSYSHIEPGSFVFNDKLHM